ncbi:hypothetical protein L209DRAFT_712676 [Thermothelomyces heterothallicus CBS 203.75]
MAPRREILDSEDDSSDFGDCSEPAHAESHEIATAGERPHEAVGASNNPSTDPADPAFSQPISDGQRGVSDVKEAAPDAGPNDASVFAWTDMSLAPPPGKKPQIEDSLLTSITDPAPKGRESRRTTTRNVGQAETIDLTNVTTPRKGAASETSDVWDVPSSTNSQRATRTAGKRKVAQLSLEQEPMRRTPPPDTQDPYAFPDATPPRKRSRRGTPSRSARQPPASSPVMLIPTKELPCSDRRTRSSGRKKVGSDGVGSTLPDTAPPSLYVTQSALSASQKREFQVVDLSSEPMPRLPRESEVHEEFSAAQSSGAGEMYRSSMATTIAYPTPSRVALQRRLPDVPGEMGDDCASSRTSPGCDVSYQQSSPDVLADMTSTTAPRSRRGSKAKDASSTGPELSEREPPSSARRAKKRKAVREIEDDHQEPDPLGTTREITETPPQATETQRGFVEDLSHVAAQPGKDVDDEDFVPEADPTDAEVMERQGPTPKPAAKGKKGKKRKGSRTQAAAPEPDEPVQTGLVAPAETSPGAAETAEPPAKRKRGRPRKSDSSKPQPEPESEEQGPEQQPEKDAGPEPEAHTAPQPLAEVDHHNSQPVQKVAASDAGDAIRETESGEKENEVAVEKDAAATDKVAEKEKQQAAKDNIIKPAPPKVQYRVGLSRRTRIAPLLKSLKKAA